jgi:hypothetical protein
VGCGSSNCGTGILLSFLVLCVKRRLRIFGTKIFDIFVLVLCLFLNTYLHIITESVDCLLYLSSENGIFVCRRQKITRLLSMKHQTAP